MVMQLANGAWLSRPLTVMVVALQVAATCFAEDWPGFRGLRGDGTSRESAVPTEWGPNQNVRWKVSLPKPSNGSPIVSNGRVFVAGCEDDAGKRRALYCFDRADGKLVWKREIPFDREEEKHKTNPHGSSTPAANGERVVVWHGSAGLHCYDFQGELKWSVVLGEFPHMWGYGTSPVIHGDRVIMHCGPGPKVSLVALDLASGQKLWSFEEAIDGDGSRRKDMNPMGSWCTPLLAKVGGNDQIICSMPTRLVGLSPQDGRLLWFCDGIRGPKGDLAYSSPVLVGDVCMCIGGYNGPGLAVKLGGAGDLTGSRLWRNETNPQSIGSGVALDGYVYRPNAGPGTIECVEPTTGKVLWTDRGAGGVMWGSIVMAAGKCYVTTQEGVTVVFKPSPAKFELVAKNDLGEPTNSTPAISDGEIFLRTSQHLYCIASGKK